MQQVAPDAGPLPHRNVPHGGVEIVAVAGVGVRVLGPLTRCTDEVLAPGTTVVGVRVEPAGAGPVLGNFPDVRGGVDHDGTKPPG